MATNLVFEGDTLSLAATSPAAPVSNDPVRFGFMTGVAVTDEGEGNNIATEATVDFGMKVWDLSVTDTVGGGIAAGATLFLVDGAPATIENTTTGYFFGFALETVGAGLTATIRVLHVPSPGSGTIGAGTIATANLAVGILSADAAGRAKMANDYFTTAQWLAASTANSWTTAVMLDQWNADAITNAVLLQAVLNGAFQADAATRALFADGIWETAKLAAGVISADATGRALFAAGVFDAATALSAFGVDSIANAFLLDAVADGAFVADANTRALFADNFITEAKINDAELTGTVAAVVADDNVIGGLTVLHRIDVADASADTDVVLTHKTRVIDAWALNTGIAAHAANDTWQVKNGANAISDAVAKTATVNAVKRISTIDPARAEIAAGGTLRITAVKDTNAAVTVYVLGIKVA